jgi:hypothetical protein
LIRRTTCASTAATSRASVRPPTRPTSTACCGDDPSARSRRSRSRQPLHQVLRLSEATGRARRNVVLIVVGVALDTMRQMESQMMMRHYEEVLEINGSPILGPQGRRGTQAKRSQPITRFARTTMISIAPRSRAARPWPAGGAMLADGKLVPDDILHSARARRVGEGRRRLRPRRFPGHCRRLRRSTSCSGIDRPLSIVCSRSTMQRRAAAAKARLPAKVGPTAAGGGRQAPCELSREDRVRRRSLPHGGQPRAGAC